MGSGAEGVQVLVLVAYVDLAIGDGRGAPELRTAVRILVAPQDRACAGTDRVHGIARVDEGHSRHCRHRAEHRAGSQAVRPHRPTRRGPQFADAARAGDATNLGIPAALEQVIPVIGTGGYVCLAALRAGSADGHPLLPERAAGDRRAVEGIVDPVLVLQAYHLMGDTADRGLEQGRRGPEVAVSLLLRSRHLPAAEQVQRTVSLDDRDGERFGATARPAVTGAEVDVARCGVHCGGTPNAGPGAASRHGI